MTTRRLGRAALDREYDNVKKVSPRFFQELIARLEASSATARKQYLADRDVAYGASGLERLDIFRAGKSGMPVHVFLHGGYWHALDKRDFSFIAHGLVPHGMTTVVLNFPLLPAVRMDAQIAACRRALRWIRDNIEAYGGDPGRISISGHSAGAHLAGMLLADADASVERTGVPALERACLVSGIYDLEPIRRSFVNDTLLLTGQEAARNSPVRLERRMDCPLAIAVGGDEGNEYLRQSSDLVQTWSQTGWKPSFRILAHENHFTLRAQFGDPESEVVRLITAAST